MCYEKITMCERVCEQSAYLVFSANVQIIDLFNLIYRIKNIETDRWLQIFFLYLLDSNKDILNRAIGRPAMMAFMILVGTYLTTGQLIPGVY